MDMEEIEARRGDERWSQAKRAMLRCMRNRRRVGVSVSRGPEIRGSEPSALPHLTSRVGGAGVFI